MALVGLLETASSVCAVGGGRRFGDQKPHISLLLLPQLEWKGEALKVGVHAGLGAGGGSGGEASADSATETGNHSGPGSSNETTNVKVRGGELSLARIMGPHLFVCLLVCHLSCGVV